jgi:hypothetical protein
MKRALIVKDSINIGDQVLFRQLRDKYIAFEGAEHSYELNQNQSEMIMSLDGDPKEYILGKVIKMTVEESVT